MLVLYGYFIVKLNEELTSKLEKDMNSKENIFRSSEFRSIDGAE